MVIALMIHSGAGFILRSGKNFQAMGELSLDFDTVGVEQTGKALQGELCFSETV